MLYIYRFAELFEEEGIHIWGISTGNEPLVNMFAGVRKDETAWNAPSFVNHPLLYHTHLTFVPVSYKK